MAKKKRTESDTLGIKKIDIGNMWGSQTQRAVENFQIGAEKIPIEIIKAIGLQKKAATQANLHFSLLNKKVGNSIIKVCNQIINLKLKDLKSRLKNCLFAEIQKPDDILIQALITKNLADYQITLDSKLIDFPLLSIDI